MGRQRRRARLRGQRTVTRRASGCLLALALVPALACDKSKSAAKAAAAAATHPPRAAVPRKYLGFPMAADPTPAPELADVFAAAKLVPIADGVGSGWADVDAGGETLWIGPVIDRLDDGKSGRASLAIRRQAFGQHVPAAGERAELDDDELLLEHGFADEQRLVVLVGEARQCIAMRGRARVISTVVGGHLLDLRWPAEGCGPGPWAPVGLVVERQPMALRWRVAACPDADPIASVWSAVLPAEHAQWTELGAFVVGDEPYALVAHDGNDGVLFVAPKQKGAKWTRLPFDAGGLAPIRHGCPPPEPTADPEPADPEPPESLEE